MAREIEMLKETDHRIFKDEEGVPTVQIGCGGVIVGDVYAVDGTYSGVCFTLGKGEVGQDHNGSHGKTSGEINSFLKITATRPESLQILIDKLELAKANFGMDKPPELKGKDEA
jgi:hypothetical protein